MDTLKKFTSDSARWDVRWRVLWNWMADDTPHDIQTEQLRSLFGNFVYNSPACIFAALYMYNYGQNLPEGNMLPTWVLGYVLFHCVRGAIAFVYMRRSRLGLSPQELHRWNIVSLISQLMSGQLMVMLALSIYPLLDFAAQMVVLMVTLIIVGATAFSLAGRLATLAIYAPQIYLSFAWATWKLDHPYGQPLAGLVLLFFALYLIHARGQHHSNVHSLALAMELKVKNEELEEVARARSRLLATVSHDLRQPAHAIGMLSERALLEQTPSLVHEALCDLNELSQSLSASLTTLMDLTRLDAGLVKAQYADIPLRQVLLRLEAEYSASARKKGLQLQMGQTEHWIRSDGVLLHGVLANLVSNAIKYTPRGCVTVDIERVGDAVTVSIADTGPGIDPDKFDLIFKEFVRLDASESGTEGLGLGLSIVRRYAALLDHPVRVESALGKGSRFAITLPAVQPLRLMDSSREPTGTASLNSPLAGSRVLVVDNVDLLLTSMTKTLSAWGCRVHSARNLREAVSIAQMHHLDVVISDYHLGDREPNGLELLSSLKGLSRGDSPELITVLMTGDVSSVLEAQARQDGVSVLHKPVRPAVLLDYLVSLLPESATH